MQPLILAGGFGLRLWPFSRPNLPKQFIKLGSEFSFFQKTLIRLKQYQDPIIIGNILHKDLIYKQLNEIGIDALVILEENVTGTYVPILFGIILAAHLNKQTIGIFPTDHFIEDMDCFFHNIDQAIDLASFNQIVTFGIKASSFNKHYGHILAINKHDNIYVAKHFIEKPQAQLLSQYNNSHNYFWNSGIFVLKPSFLNRFFKKDEEIINSYLQTIDYTKDFTIDKKIYNDLMSGSFDVLVMNKSTDFYMICADFEWIDVGNFKNIFLYYKNIFSKKYLKPFVKY